MSMTRRMLLETLGAGAATALAARRAEAASPGNVIRLNRNENAYGPSPRAIEAIHETAASDANRYPDVEAEELRRRIAAYHRIRPEQVVLGCGSGHLLSLAIDLFAGPSRVVAAARPTFELLGGCAQRLGATVLGVSLNRDYSHDLDAMRACSSGAGVVYICNPHNPSGSITQRKDLDAFLGRLPSSVVVVIDEAYHDYVGESSEYVSFIDRPIDDPRVIVTRTFSKIHGLAGLRVGYGVTAPVTARALAARLMPDAINVVALRAAAAALDDADHVRTSAGRNIDDRQEFLNDANARMLRWIDSLTNFVMLDTLRPAADVVARLAEHGILVAGPIPGFDDYIRVSIGSRSAMREFWRVWDHTMPHKMPM